MKRKFGVIISLVLMTSMMLTGCRHVFVKNPVSSSGGVLYVPTVNTTASTAFTAEGVRKVGNHTYLPDDFYERRNRDKSEANVIEARIEEADKSLDRDIYVNGVGGPMDNGEYRLLGQAYKNGAVLQDNCFCATKENKPSYTWSENDLTIPEPDVDTTGIIPVSDVFDTVFELCEQNENQMFRYRSKEPIRGTYILKAGIADGLYYEFTINEYSTVKVNALNGQVIMQNFWDGVYVD
ncbi:MAG: hypothetical protein IKN45_02580 [Lachnospiraceae bacterium]|nr:hypothetical protein [Lachnospiraceae bacterium]